MPHDPRHTPARTPSEPPTHPPLPPVPDPFGPGLITLTAHRGTGRWCKKHAGRRHYFGPLSDPEAAIAAYIRRWPSILNPRPAHAPDITLVDAMTAYLDDCDRRVAAGELGKPRLFHAVRSIKAITAHFGGRRRLAEITPPEWAAAIDACFGTHSPVVRQIDIQAVRTALGWIDRNCGCRADTGDALRNVPMRTRRRHLRLKGEQMVTPAQIRRLIKTARSLESKGNADNAVSEAAIWLSINGGMRQSEIAQLTPGAYRRDDTLRFAPDPRGGPPLPYRGWIDEARPKTEAPRRFPLWPETADALDRVAQSTGPCLLSTAAGTPLLTYGEKGVTDLLARRLSRLRKRAWPNPASRHRAATFDRFRKAFITVAKNAAVDPPDLSPSVRRTIVGHTTADVHEGYTQALPDHAFVQVAGHVRAWVLTGRGGPSSRP